MCAARTANCQSGDQAVTQDDARGRFCHTRQRDVACTGGYGVPNLGNDENLEKVGSLALVMLLSRYLVLSPVACNVCQELTEILQDPKTAKAV